MNIYDELENLKVRARSNPELAQALLATRGMKNPVSAFCRIAQEHGCTFSTMDLVSAGEDSYAAMRRSTNGGGENSPLLQGEDDLYEMFLNEINYDYEGWKNTFCIYFSVLLCYIGSKDGGIPG